MKNRVTVSLTPMAYAELDILRGNKGRSEYLSEVLDDIAKQQDITKQSLFNATLNFRAKSKKDYFFTSAVGLFNVQHFLIAQELNIPMNDDFFDKVAYRLEETYREERKFARDHKKSFKRVERDFERWENNINKHPKELQSLHWRRIGSNLRKHWRDEMRT